MHAQEQPSEPAGDLQWTKGMCVGHRPGHTDQVPQAALSLQVLTSSMGPGKQALQPEPTPSSDLYF